MSLATTGGLLVKDESRLNLVVYLRRPTQLRPYEQGKAPSFSDNRPALLMLLSSRVYQNQNVK